MNRRLFFVLLPLLAGPVFGAEPTVEFSGVVIADGHTRLAFTDPVKHTTDWVEPGGQTSGYIVVNYDAKENSVTLRKNGRDYQIPLNTSKISETAAGAPTMAAAADTVSIPIHSNLRQLAAAAKQFEAEHGGAAPTYAELVGPDKAIKELKPVDGENYAVLAFGSGAPLSITTAHGSTITLETSPALVATTNPEPAPATAALSVSNTAAPSSAVAVAPTTASTPVVSTATNSSAAAPIAGSSTATTPATTVSPVMPTAPLSPTGITYTIQRGDTLAKIASSAGLSVEQLQALNPGVNATALQPGQPIRIR